MFENTTTSNSFHYKGIANILGLLESSTWTSIVDYNLTLYNSEFDVTLCLQSLRLEFANVKLGQSL